MKIAVNDLMYFMLFTAFILFDKTYMSNSREKLFLIIMSFVITSPRKIDVVNDTLLVVIFLVVKLDSLP